MLGSKYVSLSLSLSLIDNPVALLSILYSTLVNDANVLPDTTDVLSSVTSVDDPSLLLLLDPLPLLDDPLGLPDPLVLLDPLLDVVYEV